MRERPFRNLRYYGPGRCAFVTPSGRVAPLKIFLAGRPKTAIMGIRPCSTP